MLECRVQVYGVRLGPKGGHVRKPSSFLLWVRMSAGENPEPQGQ